MASTSKRVEFSNEHTNLELSNDSEIEPPSKLFSWEEIHKHTSRDDCWMVIQGKVYDVSSWVTRHPGGDLIMQGAGREATAFFVPYHPSKVSKMLRKYEIGIVDDYKPFYTWESEFYGTMKRRVDEFCQKNDFRYDSYILYLKSLFVLIMWATFYYFGILQGSFICTLLFGFFHAHLGVSIAHDGGHGSFSKSAWLNFIAGAATDLMGGSWLIWNMQHNVGHHPHTNRQGDYEDEDFDPDARSGFPLVRLSPGFVHRPHHRYQHLYIWLLFPFVGIKWMYGDIKYFVKGNYQMMAFWNFPRKYFTIQLATKTFFFFYTLFVPMYLHGIIWALVLNSALFAVNSYVFSLLFAVNHLTDVTEFPTTGSEQTERDWAKLQVTTSTNFAIDSVPALIMSGGLNYQIEHHLFPYISHMSLPKISPIVRQTCKEFGVRYYSFDSYYDALHSYYVHLKNMGNPSDQKIKAA